MKKIKLAIACAAVLLLNLNLLFGAAPTISSFSPNKGNVGTTVTLTGTNFNTTANKNIVFFGANKAATPSAASSTSLTVVVPSGATFGPISVIDTSTNLVTYSLSYFTPTFTAIKNNITSTDFETKVDISTGNFSSSLVLGDFDGDGKIDIAVSNGGNSTVSIFRNTSSSGSISFATKVDVALPAGPSNIAIGDMDGDGKIEIITCNGNNPATVSVLKNTSSSGSISFATSFDISVTTKPRGLAIGDLDGDGKLDIAVTTNDFSLFSIYRNTSSVGNLSFASKVDISTPTFVLYLAIAEMDGDGVQDINASTGPANYLFRNTSSVGTLSFASVVTLTSTGHPSGKSFIGDIDGDEKLDITSGNSSGIPTYNVFRNTGSSGTISFPASLKFLSGKNPHVISIGDLDGDGKIDIAQFSNLDSKLYIHHNVSLPNDIRMEPKAEFTATGNPGSTAIGDLDGDGLPDIIYANSTATSTLSYYRNNPFAYYSKNSGDPETPSNWNSKADGSGSDASNITSSTTYFIQNGHTMTTTRPFTFGSSSSTLGVKNGGNLIVNHTITMTSGAKFETETGGIITLNTNHTIDTLNSLGGTINIAAGNTLTLNGTIYSSGVFKGSSTSNLTINGSLRTLSFDQTTLGTTNVLQNLIVGGTGSNTAFTLGSTLNIAPTGSVTFNAAGTKTFTTTGQTLTLQSDASNTAYIGNKNSASITGNLTVERYIPGGASRRRSRLLASPVVGGTALQWRNNASNASGLGLQITGIAGTASNFDASVTNPNSAWSYSTGAAVSNNTNGADWIGFSSGDMTLANGTGYRVLVRGDRMNDLTVTSSTTTNTTISVSGSYPSSSVVLSTIRNATFSNGWNLLGNPYPSSISWNALTKGSNLGGSYYVFDPATNAYVSWNGTVGSATDNISSGQGFFVLRASGTTDANGNLTISESHKVTGQGAKLYGKKAATNLLKCTMLYDSNNVDDSYIHFREDATESLDVLDAYKLSNPSVNLCSYDTDGNRFSINSLPALTANEKTIPLSVAYSTDANYILKLSGAETFTETTIYLADKFLNKLELITPNYTYSFATNGTPASKADGRFELLFKQSTTALTAHSVQSNYASVFPNPISHQFTILVSGKQEEASYQIYNELGKLIDNGMFIGNEKQLDASNWAFGVYFVKIILGSNQQQVIKLIK